MAESEEELLMRVKEDSEKNSTLENQDQGIPFHHFMANRWGNNGNSNRLNFLRLQNHCRW